MIADLSEARAKYPDDDADSPYDEVFLEVIARAEQSGELGKSDIGALMLWKRLNLSTRWATELNQTPDAKVRQLTRDAIARARDTSLATGEAAGQARTALLHLPGCRNGAAFASTIIAAGAPDRMAVYDRRAAAALVSFGHVHPKFNYSKYMTSVNELAHEMTEKTAQPWSIRDIDKALFMHAGVTD